jgi:CRP-like cAMP-binding protein
VALMAKLARELRVSEEQLLEVSQEPVARRAARLLLWLADAGHEPVGGAEKITVPLRRNDMAQMVGTTAETFSRVLHDFARKGLIRVDRSSIALTSRQGLEKLAVR